MEDVKCTKIQDVKNTGNLYALRCSKRAQGGID